MGKSFTNIENQVCCVIKDAECCLADKGFEYVKDANHGFKSEERYWKMLQLNAYIKALRRYEDEAKCRCHPTKVINPSAEKKCLNPQINSLPLGIESVDCFHCLTELEVLKITEVVKSLCSICNCN